MIIYNSFISTLDKANKVEPITLGILKLASLSDWGCAIRKLAVITVPIDHIVKAVAVPFIEIGEHFKDICNEKSVGMKVLKSIITPIWLPIRIAVKTACFALYFFTVGVKLPYERLKEIFKFEDPKNSYLDSIDKFQKSFGVGSTNMVEPIKSLWEEKLVVPDSLLPKVKSTILQTFDKVSLNSNWEKVFLLIVGRSDKKVVPQIDPNEEIEDYCGVFGADGPFYSHRAQADNEKVLVIQIGNVSALRSKCPTYILSFEQYSKLPYEIPEDLIQILNSCK